MKTEQDTQKKSLDVIIVGGGLAGLSAACYLARAGVNTRVFEKSAEVGGRAASQVHDGYTFNRGIHALYSGGAASEVLRELNIPYSSHQPKDIFVLRKGKFYIAPFAASTMLRTGSLSLADKLELLGLFAKLPALKSEELRKISVQAWIEHSLRRPRVRELMKSTAYTFVYSSALDRVSADVFVKKTQISLKNPVLYLDGGWQTLVNGLRKAAEQAGALITNGAHVEAVLHENGRAKGVRLNNGETLDASAVIIATSPHEATKLVDGGDYAPLREIVESLIPARVACLDVALSRLPDPRHPVVQDLEHPRFLSTQSVYARLTPQGGALVSTFKQLDPLNPGDPRENERDLENLLDTVQPDWRDVLVKRIYLPHIEAVGALPTVESNGYAGRPGPYVPGIEHLYLIGDWIGEGFLADPSFASARQVARQLIQARVVTAVSSDA
ncbi:MAG TPA: NAD(P)/FAD-dependent oxidoreductase [Ktedonobacteraceae bacterium]|nr:NAD(P)/FAD-dependent oxidoreductase [Ktedonobacteraceae bacterium]